MPGGVTEMPPVRPAASSSGLEGARVEWRRDLRAPSGFPGRGFLPYASPMPAPERYVGWINGHVGFNPRQGEQSDFLTECIWDDLMEMCPEIRDDVGGQRVELRKNVGLNGIRHTLRKAIARAAPGEVVEIDSNIDGVVVRTPWGSSTQVAFAPLAVENKTIMTAHGKAQTNRYGDARAFAAHVHEASPPTIAAFTITINAATEYGNPDEFAKVTGRNPPSAATTAVGLFKTLRMRQEITDPVGLCQAALILVIDYDGKTPTARLVTEPPAPQPGERFSYEWFLDRLCEKYRARNPSRDPGP